MSTTLVPVVLQIPEATHNALQEVVDNCNRINKKRGSCTSHGELDIPGLLMMLAQDAAMTVSRPGSWEGSNMQQVLDSHGYQ